ncbi:MAG: 3-deoxy-manno-octulosonate cytidylyltransferase [Chlamydiae bacterium]|nr:3-deoxy-manno-octulosonate cytidylyltransferase [Chlamydiota bacterium]MBI3267066.1 3-deoxy-manno-octulosonate cytidylyltransferase [Chlamydiota bacterium]
MSTHKIIGVIPARLGSTRFPQKVLADLCGKPMIQHVYEGAKSARLLTDLIVACDHQSIVKAVEAFGGRALLTSKDHVSGTDRVAEIARKMDGDIFVNIQGDEPLMSGTMVDKVVQGLLEGDAQMSTLARAMTGPDGFQESRVVKVVCDESGFALYFSRSPIPFFRNGPTPSWLKHMGIYAYRRDFLLDLASSEPSSLERAEGLEQLRVLERGGRIKVMVTQEDSIGVDTPEDLEEVKKILWPSTSL